MNKKVIIHSGRRRTPEGIAQHVHQSRQKKLRDMWAGRKKERYSNKEVMWYV